MDIRFLSKPKKKNKYKTRKKIEKRYLECMEEKSNFREIIIYYMFTIY